MGEIYEHLVIKGYSIVNAFYTQREVVLLRAAVADHLDDLKALGGNQRHAIRQLMVSVPELKNLVFTQKLCRLLIEMFSEKPFLTKAILFDKPVQSNWFVAYHQDLSIAVNQKEFIPSYSKWTFKDGVHGVIPPLHILNNSITVRIHLDETTQNNGALRVLPRSHTNGIIRTGSDLLKHADEKICELSAGGIMLMKPLLFHASNRSTDDKPRRVIHLEFNTLELDSPLEWHERLAI